VVAIAENGAIGRGGALPWRLSSDLKRFKALTLGKPILMGRATWASLGRPLPGRTNVVLTRGDGAALRAAGALVAGSLEAALALPEVAGSPEVVVIGGAQLYEAALPRCDEAWITRVHASPAADAFFRFDPQGFTLAESEAIAAGERDEHATTFERWVRAR
jgi:dihydrofolate reductase